MYSIQRPTSDLNLFSARSKIWNCRRTSAKSETVTGVFGISEVTFSIDRLSICTRHILRRSTLFLRKCSKPISYDAYRKKSDFFATRRTRVASCIDRCFIICFVSAYILLLSANFFSRRVLLTTVNTFLSTRSLSSSSIYEKRKCLRLNSHSVSCLLLLELNSLHSEDLWKSVEWKLTVLVVQTNVKKKLVPFVLTAGIGPVRSKKLKHTDKPAPPSSMGPKVHHRTTSSSRLGPNSRTTSATRLGANLQLTQKDPQFNTNKQPQPAQSKKNALGTHDVGCCVSRKALCTQCPLESWKNFHFSKSKQFSPDSLERPTSTFSTSPKTSNLYSNCKG